MDEDQVLAPPPQINPADALVLECLAEGMAGGKHHKYKKSGPLGPYIRAARWIPAGIDPFVDPRVMLFQGMTAELRRPEDEPLGETVSERTSRLRSVKAFQKFKAALPGIVATLIALGDHSDLLEEFVCIHVEIIDNARHARSEDIFKVRSRGIRHILGDDFESRTFDPPLDPYGDKNQRGWNHPQTARALCPMHSLTAFDDDAAAFMDHVKEGAIKIKSAEFPAFIYSSVTRYNPRHRCHGLLRGEVLLRSFRLLFTGASSAATGVSQKGTKRCKAAIYGLREPTPETIAYAAVLDRYSFSSVDPWSNIDGPFQLDRFWTYLVRLFDPKDGLDHQWIEDTMHWWKVQNPALKNLPFAEDDDYNSEDDEDNDFTILRRQRQDGHGQEAADDDEDFYLDPEPVDLVAPVAQQGPQFPPYQTPPPRSNHLSRSQVSPRHTQSPLTTQHRAHKSQLAPSHIENQSAIRDNPFRAQVAAAGPQIPPHQIHTPTTPIHKSQADIAQPPPRPVPTRSHVAPPHAQSPPTIQHHSHGSQVASPRVSSPPNVPNQSHRSQAAPPHAQDSRIAPPHTQNPPHGAQDDGTPSPASPPRAHRHQEIERGQSPRSRAPSSEVDQLLPASPLQAALNVTQLNAANNLLCLKAAAWSAAHDTRLDNPVPVLQGEQPLKAIQPLNHSQVLNHPPITIRISAKRTRDQAVHETNEEYDELEEEATVPPVKKARRARKKALAPPDAQIENLQPSREPTPTPSLPPLPQSPPRKTRAKNTKAATKARSTKRHK